MRVTIKDVARHTGLSTTTVSLVLNNKGKKISPETKEKVRQAAEKLHYRPNQLAVGLITQKTRTLGLIVPDIANPFFAELAKGTQEECQKHGFSLLLSCTNDNPERDVHYVQTMIDHNVDGMILAIMWDSMDTKARECIQLAQQAGKAVVLVDRTIDDPQLTLVRFNHEQAGYLATKHLLDLGHRRIGCITGPMGIETARQRLYGYIRALQETGRTFDDSLTYEGDFHMEKGYEGAGYLLGKDVSAIFATNDTMATGVFQYAFQKGISIPEELSLVGYDNTFMAQLTVPPLTTIHQPVYDYGAAAVKGMLEQLGQMPLPDEGHVCDILFEPRLVMRSSTAEWHG